MKLVQCPQIFISSGYNYRTFYKKTGKVNKGVFQLWLQNYTLCIEPLAQPIKQIRSTDKNKNKNRKKNKNNTTNVYMDNAAWDSDVIPGW